MSSISHAQSPSPQRIGGSSLGNLDILVASYNARADSLVNDYDESFPWGSVWSNIFGQMRVRSAVNIIRPSSS